MILNIHQKISLVLITAFLMISMYDAVFHFLLWLLHILFESAEFFLDHFVDHLFDIGNRETEIMVFYIMISLIGCGFYQLYRSLPHCKNQFKQWLEQQKNETFMQWHELSVLTKMAWWGGGLTAFNCWLFLSF